MHKTTIVKWNKNLGEGILFLTNNIYFCCLRYNCLHKLFKNKFLSDGPWKKDLFLEAVKFSATSSSSCNTARNYGRYLLRKNRAENIYSTNIFSFECTNIAFREQLLSLILAVATTLLLLFIQQFASWSSAYPPDLKKLWQVMFGLFENVRYFRVFEHCEYNLSLHGTALLYTTWLY